MFIFNRLKNAIALRNRVSELERQNKNQERWRRWFVLRMEKLEKRMSETQEKIDNLTKKVQVQNETLTKVTDEVKALKEQVEAGEEPDFSNLEAAIDEGTAKLKELDDVNPDAGPAE